MELLGILGLTVQIAVVGTAINLPIALGVSWLIVKRRIPGRLVFDALVSLPLAVPPVVVGYALLLLLGNRGPVGGLLNRLLGVELVFTWFIAALAAAVVSFPLMARAVMVAMGGVDEHLEMAARSLGAGAMRVFFTITVPLAYRGILAGGVAWFRAGNQRVRGDDCGGGQYSRKDADAASCHILGGAAWRRCDGYSADCCVGGACCGNAAGA